MKLLKRLLLFSLAIATIFIVPSCVRKEKSDKEVISYFKSIESYKSKALIVIANDRQTIEYPCSLYYDIDRGARLDLGEDRIYLYRNKTIQVKDLVSKRTYEKDESFDKLYYMAFINEYIKLMYVNEDTKYYIEEKNGKRYQLVELTIPDNNRNMAKAVLYVDSKALVPEKILIYDYKGRERVKFTYSEFVANEKLDEKLFSFQ